MAAVAVAARLRRLPLWRRGAAGCASIAAIDPAIAALVAARHEPGVATLVDLVSPPAPLAPPPLTPYPTAWRWQQALTAARHADAALADVVLLLQHDHVFTLGRSSQPGDLRFTPGDGSVLAEVHRVERGGRVTYHGPGQLVVYPIMHLAHAPLRQDLHWYVTCMEEVMMRALRSEFGLATGRVKGLPGVWVDGARKVAQVGIACSKWVTMHGVAINVAPDMRYFGHIVPCGITDRAVTSVAAEVARAGEMKPATPEELVARTAKAVVRELEAVFGVELRAPR